MRGRGGVGMCGRVRAWVGVGVGVCERELGGGVITRGLGRVQLK